MPITPPHLRYPKISRTLLALLLLTLASSITPRLLHASTLSTTTPKPKRAPAAKPAKTKSTKSKKSTKTATAVSLRPIPYSSREAIAARITQNLATPRLGVENPKALRPFFDQLHQAQLDPHSSLIRIIQFGDSHTAADIFTGAMRTLFQTKFGDGGAGFQYPGYPFTGYRIHGTHRAQSTGWIALGTHLRDIGDGLVGMGGISLSTTGAGNWVSLDADASSLEVQYLIQPNGGTIDVYDGDTQLTTIPTASTDPSTANTAGHYDTTLAPGPHHIEVRTTQEAPVRLLGLSTENASGVTYEAAGINGAEASLFLRWNEALQQTLMLQANPALIVLSYGTNEAGDHNWTEDSYAALFRRIIERCRRLAPSASILVIGPPDRALHNGRHGWAAFTGVDRIVQAQRTVCRQMNCAYWDQRARMGGFGSMRDWVSIAWAQPDHTHFTAEGYNELAGALFSDIVQQYDADQDPTSKAAADSSARDKAAADKAAGDAQ
ncbi:SGNH/GDSL hydrolase family protein [Granulicella sp. L60]|uniref:SGNH/GDSL hydrolase family protein n=1 Tax=Granulicella sp. L60 TaxID=1641866 RepID=UPI00131C996A|nr:SGNH/GDSL hydrolase family protein [Granulicella sp. L60]